MRAARPLTAWPAHLWSAAPLPALPQPGDGNQGAPPCSAAAGRAAGEMVAVKYFKPGTFHSLDEIEKVRTDLPGPHTPVPGPRTHEDLTLEQRGHAC